MAICSVVSAYPDPSTRLEALEARVERSEIRELQLEARAKRAEKVVEQLKSQELQLEARATKTEQEIKQLKGKLAIQNSSSFFSVQFKDITTIPHGEILDFDDVIVNCGDDYIQSGGLYM